MLKKFFLSIVALSLLSITLSYSQSDRDYFNDKVIISISDNAGTINIHKSGNFAQFGIPALDNIALKLGVTKIEKLFPNFAKPSNPALTDLSGIYTVYFPVEAGVFRVIDEFKQNSDIIYAEPYFIRKTSFNPNDPFTNQQYALTNTQAYQAWDYNQGNSNVVVGIIDTGMDMDHPDLADNRWINPGEDLNGNGVIDPSEINNIDNDSNGHVDDFYGWDCVGNDNNMNDTYGHGTHTAGIASAVTNNGAGVASIGFNASIMVVRVGSGPGITAAIQGVTYAIENGADIISMSYGGGGFSQTEQNLFNSANEQGIICIAAAGNYNSQSVFYPAGYTNVVSVAATNSTDHKASFSNYGSWIDISAPGENIYSTYLNAGYTDMSGTSMSCPMTAGLAALIKSAYPQFDADPIMLIMEVTSDNLNGINPNYFGMLGWGRINAYKSMSMLYSDADMTLTPALPQIVIPASGGQFQYDRLIQNTGTTNRIINVYTAFIRPNGTLLRANNEMGLSLPAGGQLQNLNLIQTIPSSFSAGEYSFIVLALNSQGRTILAMDYFTFVKSGTLDNGKDSNDPRDLSALDIDAPLSIIDNSPVLFSLSQPFPNPFNPETSLSFTLPEDGKVSLKVYDLQGRQVAVLADGWKNSGVYEVKFDGYSLSSGIYFAVLNSGASTQIRKLTLIK